MNNILIILLPRAECYLPQKEKLKDERRSLTCLGSHSNSLFWFLWHCIVQCSPYQAVTSKIYHLKQQFLWPATS